MDGVPALAADYPRAHGGGGLMAGRVLCLVCGAPVQGQELDLVGRSLSVNVHNNTNIARLQSKVWQGLFENNLRVRFKHDYL